MRSEVILWNLCFLFLPRSLLYHVAAYDVTPRWGQATVVINDALFVFGGKTDEFNSFSYSAAPTNNDLLYLSISSSFSGASPPWKLVCSSTNSSTSQGPALSWSTLSAFNTSNILLFGGQPGPNSQTVIVDAADSAAILDVFNRLAPQWTSEPALWAGEPDRRIRHSATTAPSGLVFIFGGEKADGSNNAFSDHYMFDSKSQAFTLLPSDNGPPDLYGHTSIILSDGRILVFGGYSQSQGSLVPLSTIWVLDTGQSSLSWSVINTSATFLPSPRIAFAAALVTNGQIIIHGGSDANFQSNFADGWLLDTKQNPMTWTQVDALSQLGARRDHFAVCSGDQVIFGFGYGNNGPASAALEIFDLSDDSFPSSFTPPPAASMSQTLPVPPQTSHLNTPTGFLTTSSGVHPTSSTAPNVPSGNNSNHSNAAAIAVGTTFGVMGLIFVAIGATYYIRRQHQNREGDRQFIALGHSDDGDDDDSAHFDSAIATAGMHEFGETREHRGILTTLGLAGALRTVRNSQYQRRDMLADEDAHSFGEWYNSRRRDGTGGSSWSLRSILGRTRSRQASTTSHGTGGISTPWREKLDPFSDGAAPVRDEETGFIGAATVGSRPRARRQISYASSRSGVSYRDPFDDPIEEETRINHFLLADDSDGEHPDDRYEFSGQPTVRHVAPSLLPPIRTILPPSQQIGQTLSPLSEHTSQSTLPLQTFGTSGSSQAHSSELPSPFPGGSISQATSLASLTGSPNMKTTPITGASDFGILNTNQPMKRSDSWWTRFSRSGLLERRSSDAARTRFDIRDPNPAPRLGAIDEASISSTPATARSSPGSGQHQHPQAPLSGANSSTIYTAGVGTGHGKSMSSLRTADSEAIERMAGTMDVVQRIQSKGSRWGSGSTSSVGGLSIDTHVSVSEKGDASGHDDDHQIMSTSPTEDPFLADDPAHLAVSPSSPPSAYKTAGLVSPSKVTERVHAYERRMSQGPTSPPTNSKQREERSTKRIEVNYGLAPRPSLFLANPDHRLSSRSVDS